MTGPATGPVPGRQRSGDALDALAARARAALDGDVPEAQNVEGPFVGTAADGQVSAEVGSDGTLRSLLIERAALDQPLDEVASAARAAVNAALDARPGNVDFAPVIEQVRAAQDEARRNLTALTQGMDDVERSIHATRERIR